MTTKPQITASINGNHYGPFSDKEQMALFIYSKPAGFTMYRYSDGPWIVFGG